MIEKHSERFIEGTEPIVMPTPHGEFVVRAWRGSDAEHLSMESGWSAAGAESAPPLVRVHSECATGDIFGSYRCDCGEQLVAALERIHAEGGILIYMRGQEGRGIGLFNKIRAYRLQDEGADTVDANILQGLPVDARRFDDAALILKALGARSIRLLTNNPLKDTELEEHGIEVVETVPSIVPAREANARYLATKRERMDHRLPQPLQGSSHFDDLAM